MEPDSSQLLYRAVLVPPTQDNHQAADATTTHATQSSSSPTQLCGLVLVACPFAAYALSRLVEELCVWDPDLYFLKPGHLSAHQHQPVGGQHTSDGSSNPTLKAGEESTAGKQVVMVVSVHH